MTPQDDNLVKRIDSMSSLLDFVQKRVNRLEEMSDETRDILTQLQISIGNLGEYFQRQRDMEEDLVSLRDEIGKLQVLGDSIKRVEVVLWGVAVGMIPGIMTIIWELAKHWFGK